MKKMNKKGFTLIEMLVVIAIIAVLVAIIIPVVTSSTEKAAAATNAANLRSMVAEATTKILGDDLSTDGTVKLTKTGTTYTIEATSNAPVSKEVGSCPADQTATLTWDGSKVTASYAGFTLDQFVSVADGDVAPKDLTTPSIQQGGNQGGDQGGNQGGDQGGDQD